MVGLRTRFLKAPSLSGAGGELTTHVESWIQSSSPADLKALLDPASVDLLIGAFSKVGGCEGTVWLGDQKGNLVAVYNSGSNADSLVGFEQPIGSGIISMVYAQQQPYCENSIQASSGHDDTLDRKVAKHTSAMIAVPLYFAFGLRGVVSCVQFVEEKGPSKRGFHSEDVAELARVTNVVERLINETLLTSVLGLNDAGCR